MTVSEFITTPWLGGVSDLVLLAVRFVAGGVMVYYGWEKLRDPKANATDFEQNIAKPGWLFGTLVMVTEFFGGLAVIFSIAVPLAASAIAFEMLVGTLTKAFRWKKPFSDWSYDVLVLALCLVLLAFGSGAFTLT